MSLLELGYKVFISYLAGSLNGALLVGLLYGGIDIRTQGSGNAGGTNALRTQGKLFASLVMFVDIGKGVLPVLLLPSLSISFVDTETALSREWLTYACGGAAIFGHCYPVWFEFQGGKGAATMIGVLAIIWPPALIPASLTWLSTLFIFGDVGLATVVAGFSIPAYVMFVDGGSQLNLFIFVLLVACFVAFTHRSNLREFVTGKSLPDIRSSLLGRFRRQ
ncbi:MAG: glycerol-3-phosphate acyltransferase [Gammaproteobacteria bacterium]